MLVTYTAVDGYSITNGSTAAWLMADTAADMIIDQVGNSPLKNLTINGTITTSAVKTGATTLAASGFTSNDHYYQLWDAALDPDTSGFSMKFWIKYTSVAAFQRIFDKFIGGSPTPPRISLFKEVDDTLSGEVFDGTTTRTVTTTATYADDDWHCVVFVCDGANLYLYVDGALTASETGSALNTLTSTNAGFYIGRGYVLANPWGGSIAGAEYVAQVQWTAQQIKMKYDLEAILFRNYEPFSIVGESIQYEVNLLSSSISNEVLENFHETLNGTRSGLTWYRKRGYSCQTVPFARDYIGDAQKFLRSTNNVTFTFDERGSLSNSPITDDPITVYKTSSNEVLQFNNPYYSFAFSLREV